MAVFQDDEDGIIVALEGGMTVFLSDAEVEDLVDFYYSQERNYVRDLSGE